MTGLLDGNDIPLVPLEKFLQGSSLIRDIRVGTMFRILLRRFIFLNVTLQGTAADVGDLQFQLAAGQ